jgi:threonine synthase
VSDKQIIGAIPALARSTGVFAEPAAAAVFAGAQAAVQSGMIGAAESVLLLVTGNGLKDVRRAQESVAGGLRVQPTLESVRQALNL